MKLEERNIKTWKKNWRKSGLGETENFYRESENYMYLRDIGSK